MGKILSVKKIEKGSITLDESIMDNLFLNEGDYIAFVEENNKIYVRKTRKPQVTDQKDSNEIPPPPTFEEKSTEFSEGPKIGGNNIRYIFLCQIITHIVNLSHSFIICLF